MCGIAGFISRNGPAPSEFSLEAMLDPIRHRGPDGEGLWEEKGAHIGHLRLSIIDLEGGRQPMADQSGRYVATFNGEIYNFLELREFLLERGVTLNTRSDSEVLPNLYALEGPKMVHRLRGMFAFAIWDREKRELFLARDRVGIKPLFYSTECGGMAFASELAGLLAHPSVPKETDADALAEYFILNYIPEPKSAYRSVKKLQAGHWLLWRDGEVTENRYWDLPAMVEEPVLDFNDCVEQLDACLREAVACRMMSEVPLGAFLSGGLDSGLVVSYMAEASTSPVKTFSVGFEQEAFNELPLARRVAEKYATDHHEEIVRPKAMDLLEFVGGMFQEPFGDSSALPTFLVSRMARKNVTVCLSGDGGDEGFAGYTRYQKLAQVNDFRRWPAFLRRLGGVLGGLIDLPRFRQLRRLARRSLMGDPECYFEGVNFLGERNLLEAGVGQAARQRALNLFNSHYRGESVVRSAQYLDVKTYLINDILTKVDRASMAVSLEARVPLLDHHLLELANGFPTKFKFDGIHKKKLLRALAERRLPAGHLDAPKRGFALPLAHWFRNELKPLVEEVLCPEEIRRTPWLSDVEVQKVVSRHISGSEDLSHQIWSLLVYQIWLRAQGLNP